MRREEINRLRTVILKKKFKALRRDGKKTFPIIISLSRFI
jgi:hypothetical protein